jgi:hypothetical protein
MKITQPIVIDELRMVSKTWANSQAGLPGERALPMAGPSVEAIPFPSLNPCGEGQEREETRQI